MAIGQRGGEGRTEEQKQVMKNLDLIGMPPTAYNIDLILPKGGRINEPELTKVLVQNGKSEAEAARLAREMTAAQTEAPNGRAQQKVGSYGNGTQNTVETKMKEAREDAKSPQTLTWLEGELKGLDAQEEAARRNGNFEQAAVLESTQNYLVENVAFIEQVRARYGNTAAQDAERALHQVAEECVASRVSPFDYAERDTSESKNPLNHLTEFQAQLIASAGLRLSRFFVTLKTKLKADEEEMVDLANMSRDNTAEALKADAALRGSKPQDYQALLAEDNAERRQDILEKTGFTENTARYIEGYTAKEMGSAFAAAGLSILAGALTGEQPVFVAPGTEGAVAAQFQMDNVLRQKDAQQQKEEMDKMLEELEGQNEKDTVGEAELSTETKEMLERMGIEQDETIKEAIESVETIIANVEMQNEKIEGLMKGFNEENWEEGMAPPFHNDPMEVLEANGLMEDGKLTELGKEVLPELLQESAADFMQACDTILFRIEIVGNEELMDKLNDAKRAVEAYMMNPESAEAQAEFSRVMQDPEIVAVQAAFFEAIAENAGEVAGRQAEE